MKKYTPWLSIGVIVIFSFVIAAVASGRATITGGVVMIDGMSEIFGRVINTTHLYLFLSVTVLGTILGAGYQRTKAPSKVQRLTAKAKKHLSSGAFDNAVRAYEETKLLYEKMNAEEKLKSHSEVMGVYNQLLWHYKTREAQDLAERYAKGDLSPEELKKLELLLQEAA